VIGEAHVMLTAADLLTAANPLRVTVPLIAPKTIYQKWFVEQTPAGSDADGKGLNHSGPTEWARHAADCHSTGIVSVGFNAAASA